MHRFIFGLVALSLSVGCSGSHVAEPFPDGGPRADDLDADPPWFDGGPPTPPPDSGPWLDGGPRDSEPRWVEVGPPPPPPWLDGGPPDSAPPVWDGGPDAEPPLPPSESGCETGRELRCTCLDSRVGTQTCTVDGSFAACECFGDPVGPSDLLLYTFERVTEGMVGRWVGSIDTPWEGVQPVDISFRDDGTYTTGAFALYWGPESSAPHPYRTVDVYASGYVHGDIQLWPGEERITPYILDSIELSADGNELIFELWNRDRDHAGPPLLRLQRRR